LPSPFHRWRDPAWLDEAYAWIDAALDRAGVQRTTEVEQPHVEWWATALRVPTDAGVLWFKAAQPDGAYEAPLTRLLATEWPDLMAEVVDGDEARGWLLTRDAGARFRDVDSGPSLDLWEQLLPRYAEVQHALASRVDELLALGVPYHRLSALPSQVEAALDDPDVLHPGHVDGLTPEQRDAVVAALPRLREECSRLAGLGVPETLQHDDLHDGNAFVRGGRPVLFDWGDAVVSHPFHTLVVTLRALAYKHKLAPGGTELLRLRDAYLEPWTSLARPADLAAAADLARRTGTIQRAMAWHRVARLMPPEVRIENIDSVAYGLRLYLLDAPWGTWDDGTF
jgi:hypothetical protein